MKSANNRFVRTFACGAVALVVGGCAVGGVPLFKKSEKTEEALPDVHPIRKERASLAAKKFDVERNAAEYQAAAAEWRQGNFKACRDGIDKILYRDPAHRDSLILLAELELEHDQPELAVDILRRGIAAHPKDGEMSYKLGLALESAGESSEALHHFHMAVQLAPQEKKFADVFKHAEEHAKQSAAQDGEQVADGKVAPATPDDNETSDNSGSEPTIQLTANQSPLEVDPQSSTKPSSSVSSPIELAVADWEAGRKEACAKTVGEILAHDPKHIDANILQVELDLDAGRSDEARARIERLAIRNPQNAQVRRACALAYEALGDAARAATSFAAAETLELGAIEDAPRVAISARAKRIKPTSIEPASIKVVSISETLQQATPMPTESLQSESSTIEPPNLLAADTLAPALPILGLEVDEPEAPVKATVSTVSTVRNSVVDRLTNTGAVPRRSAQQLLDKGEVFLKAGRFDDAQRELSAAISANSCVVKTASAAALAPLRYEQSALALDLAREGVKKFPDSAGLHRIEGTAALRLGRHLEAEAALRQSLSLDNSQALTYFLLGSVYDRLGNQEAADRHLRQAARLDRRYAVRK